MRKAELKYSQTVRLTKYFHTKLRVLAAFTDENISDLIQRLLEPVVDKELREHQETLKIWIK